VLAGVWCWAAWAPLDRETWLLENLLVFAAVAGLAASQRRFVFSNVSYGLIFGFLLLHTVGAHYTYSEVPLGALVRDHFELTRNHYDRLVHFAFGLLLAYPLRELTLRVVHAHRVWSYLLPVLATIALSAGYEILEWAAARTVNPEVGVAYVGAQGDVWDGQKDMALALTGAIAAMLATRLWRTRSRAEPYLGASVDRTPG
jgi:putative membrane protein